MFSGSAMATRCVAEKGYRCTDIDIDHAKQYEGYSKNGKGSPFDILSSSGFSWLIHWTIIRLTFSFWMFWGIFIFFKKMCNYPNPRIAAISILGADPTGFVVWMGILCSTWSAMSRGSTFRSWLWPLGLESLQCVSEGNTMVARTGVQHHMLYTFLFLLPNRSQEIFDPIGLNLATLRCCCLMILIHVCNGVWILEQPRQTLMNRHPRFVELTKKLVVVNSKGDVCVQHLHQMFGLSFMFSLRSSDGHGGCDCSHHPPQSGTLHSAPVVGFDYLT